METRKHWLLSRKFWIASATALVLILQDTLGIELDPENLVAVILPVVAYILGESYIDARSAGKKED